MVSITNPFNINFDTNLILKSTFTSIDTKLQNDYLKKLLKWLCLTPKITTFRVNTLICTVDEVYYKIDNYLSNLADNCKRKKPYISKHPLLNEVIIIHNWDLSSIELTPHENEVVVDVHCAAAVLRGSHIFAPGVMSLISGTKHGDRVSIYSDVSKKCKKGLQKCFVSDSKIFIGNGIIKMTRKELFGENLTPKGVAVEVTDNISGCPVLCNFLPPGLALLQNLPSIVCIKVLNPQLGDVILDMCASPGNKTTHIAALLNNTGTIIAIDKTPSKIEQLKSTCKTFKANVNIYKADSTKIYDECLEGGTSVTAGPPFSKESFDKISLDAPCSALGKRPQLYNNITEKVLKSYVPLQRKLFENAVNILKTNGNLVYSTCTVTTAENEGIVAWALKTFRCLKLVKAEPFLGDFGLSDCGLSETDRKLVQRFGPNQEIDSVGFFIAHFIKNQ